MEKYLCASPLNKTNFFTLPEPRDLRDNLTCFDLHKSLYGFEPRAVELLLRSWPWNGILEDIKMIGLGFLCFCRRRESAMNIVLILVFLLWLNGSFVGLGCLFTALWPPFKPKHGQMSVFSVVLQLDYTEEPFERKKRSRMNKFCADSCWEQLDTMLFLIHTQKIKLLCSFYVMPL